jgi:hypothetical protein
MEILLVGWVGIMRRKVSLLALIILIWNLLCVFCCYGALFLLNEPTFDEITLSEELDVTGIWQAYYGSSRIDRLVINKDGTFQQTYREPGFEFISSNNQWFLKPYPEKGVRLFLEGGHYYYNGVNSFNRHFGEQRPYIDSITRKPIGNYDKELVLAVVQRHFTNQLVLVHLQRDADPDSIGFPIIGLEKRIFFRISH